MIVDAIISLINTLLGAAFSVLPTADLPGMSTTTGSGGCSSDICINMYQAGNNAGKWNGIINLLWIFNYVLPIVYAVMVGVVLYKVLNWIYRHIPQIGGFGPGSG